MDVASAVLWIFPLLFAVVLHEFAHGWAAARLGDDTAARLGRLTLNPLAHVDLVGTIVMPALLFMSGSPFLFGYAKPVPVDWTRLRDPRRELVVVHPVLQVEVRQEAEEHGPEGHAAEEEGAP